MERPEHDFHVVGNEIVIDFAVPLPASSEDQVLTRLLTHHAAGIIRDRKQRGQPLDGIPVARIRAMRGAESVDVAFLDLEESEDVYDLELPDLLRLGTHAGYDPLAKLGSREEGETLKLSRRTRGDRLGPIRDDIELTVGIATGLRSLGIDPERVTMAELGPGLLRLAGYRLTERDDGSLLAIGAGNTVYVDVIAHQEGEYPELEERRLTSFIISFARSHADRGLLLTDKYGPYEVYEKERANPKCHFITRERMQGFVDAIALG
jgi:hypothetical protein